MSGEEHKAGNKKQGGENGDKKKAEKEEKITIIGMVEGR